MRATGFFQKTIERGTGFASDLSEQYLTLVDILRRSGQSEMALAYCREGMEELQGTIESALLEFEWKLILAGDTAGHSIGEVEIPTFDVHPSSIDDRVLAKRVRLFPKLKTLKLRKSKISDDGLAVLRDLACLEFLDLVGTNITDNGLRHLNELASLKTLDLGYTRVSDAGLKHLQGLNQLQELRLDDTKVTAAGVEKLRRALPGLYISH